MKKSLVIISLLAGIGFSAFALFKILTFKEDGKAITKNDTPEAGNSSQEESKEGGETPGT